MIEEKNNFCVGDVVLVKQIRFVHDRPCLVEIMKIYNDEAKCFGVKILGNFCGEIAKNIWAIYAENIICLVVPQKKGQSS